MKIKGGTIKGFNKLSNTRKIAEVRKLAKRANVRLAYMEEQGVHNDVYNYANTYNSNIGRKKNRFFEGSKYKDTQSINDAYKVLRNFLNNKTSLMTGVKESVIDNIKKDIKNNTLSYPSIMTMEDKEKEYVTSYLAKRSNSRLKALEKKGFTKGAYAKAEIYNLQSGREKNSFYTGHNFKNVNEMNLHIYNMIKFLNSKTSTVKGWNEINKKRINTFRSKGINIPHGKEEEFNNFLSSKQFAGFNKQVDSNQVIKMYHNAKARNKTIDEINEEFDKFMNDDYYFDEVLEDLGIAPWQEGNEDLLH